MNYVRKTLPNLIPAVTFIAGTALFVGVIAIGAPFQSISNTLLFLILPFALAVTSAISFAGSMKLRANVSLALTSILVSAYLIEFSSPIWWPAVDRYSQHKQRKENALSTIEELRRNGVRAYPTITPNYFFSTRNLLPVVVMMTSYLLVRRQTPL